MWKLFGGSSYGLFASTVVLDIVAIGLSLWMALRRGGRALLLAIAAVLAVLMRAYGAFLLTLPWNPYLPVLWWFVFVLAVWSVLADDLAMLPVAVFAGSFCMQTHISYLGLVGGLVVRRRASCSVASRTRAGATPRRGARSGGGAASACVVGVVLWIPPVIDQFAHSPGNLGDHPRLLQPSARRADRLRPRRRRAAGAARPVEAARRARSCTTAARSRSPVRASRARSCSIAFAASVVVAWRLRHRVLLALDAVLVVALALGLVSSARIFGTVWFYLLLWAWALVRAHAVRDRLDRASSSCARASTRTTAAAPASRGAASAALAAVDAWS